MCIKYNWVEFYKTGCWSFHWQPKCFIWWLQSKCNGENLVYNVAVHEVANLCILLTIIKNFMINYLQADYVITPLAGIQKYTQIGSKSLKSAAGCSQPICKWSTHCIWYRVTIILNFYSIISNYDSKSVMDACNDVDVIIATMGTGNQVTYWNIYVSSSILSLSVSLLLFYITLFSRERSGKRRPR